MVEPTFLILINRQSTFNKVDAWTLLSLLEQFLFSLLLVISLLVLQDSKSKAKEPKFYHLRSILRFLDDFF